MKAHQLKLIHIRDNLDFYTKTILSKDKMPPAQYQMIMGQWHYARSRLHHIINRNWLVNLIATLDAKRQAILKTYLNDNIGRDNGGRTIQVTNSSDHASLEEEILSGKLKQEIKTDIQRLQEILDKTRDKPTPTITKTQLTPADK
jgi:hypothetical protein